MRPAAVEMETADGKWVHLAMGGLLLTPPMLRKLAEWMDETGMADDLLDDKYMEADFCPPERRPRLRRSQGLLQDP